MVKVAQHISTLLYCHDCVILPDFGGFVTNYKQAKLDTTTKTAHPPSKSLSFNKFLTHNDGLLINEISQKEGLSYKSAEEVVSKYATFCKTTLKSEGRLELDKLGVFYLTENRIQFKASNINYLTSAFGFTSLVFNKLEEKKAEPKPIERKEESAKENRQERPVLVQKEKAGKNVFPKYVLTALSILFLFYSAWIPLKTDVLKTGNIEISELNPFAFDKCPPVYEPTASFSSTKVSVLAEENEAKTELEIDGKLFTVVDDSANIAESTYVEPKVEKTTWNRTYYVVAGCFQYEENATGLLEELKAAGFEYAEIIDKHKGLYRVSFGKFPSRKKAKTLYDSIRKEGKSTWILKK